MSVLVILSLCTRAPSNGTGGGGNGSICVIGPSRVHLPSTILHGTPITLLMASLSHLSFCSILLTSRALNNCFSLPARLRTCIWSPSPCLRMVQILVQASCHVIFRTASDRLDPSGTWTKCSPHVPPTTARLGSLHMARDGSDDTAQQHHCFSDQSV